MEPRKAVGIKKTQMASFNQGMVSLNKYKASAKLAHNNVHTNIVIVIVNLDNFCGIVSSQGCQISQEKASLPISRNASMKILRQTL